jgi:hypothetical protein
MIDQYMIDQYMIDVKKLLQNSDLRNELGRQKYNNNIKINKTN